MVGNEELQAMKTFFEKLHLFILIDSINRVSANYVPHSDQSEMKLNNVAKTIYIIVRANENVISYIQSSTFQSAAAHKNGLRYLITNAFSTSLC